MLDSLAATPIQCADRPLHTQELHETNDFYSHAAILKQYAGLPADYTVKAAAEHSMFCTGFAWHVDYNAPFPSILTMGSYRFGTLRSFTDKLLFSVGPIGQYAPLLASPDIVANTKATLGKTLLVFVPKSSHRVEVALDAALIIRKVDKVSTHFDTILFCFGWKDVLLGRTQAFSSYGTCVSAGHMYARPFLSNLRTLFALADMSMSFSRGSHIAYSILFDTPHYLQHHPWDAVAPDAIKKADLLPASATTEALTKEHKALFGSFSFDVTTTQRAYMHRVAGIKDRRTPQELTGILLLVEEVYRVWQKDNTFAGRAIAVTMAEQLLQQGRPDLAQLLTDTLQLSDWSDPDMVTALGRIAVTRKDRLAAVKAARRLLEVAPERTEQARELIATP